MSGRGLGVLVLGLWVFGLRFLDFGLWPGAPAITRAATGTETRKDLEPKNQRPPYLYL